MRRAHDELAWVGLGRHDRLVGEVAQQLAARIGTDAARRADAPYDPRGVEQPVARRAHRGRDRGAREQDRADDEQEEDEDPHAETLDERIGEPIERFAHDPSVRLQVAARPGRALRARCGGEAERARGERERDSGEDACGPGAQRAQRGQHGAKQQHAAAEHERGGREHPRAAEHPPEAHGERVARAPARRRRARSVEDEAHENAERDQRETEHVALALLEHGHPQPAAEQARERRA